jgi:hypothetical protein
MTNQNRKRLFPNQPTILRKQASKSKNSKMLTLGATRTSLTEPEKRLARIFHRIQFGRIEGMLFRDGEPAFDPLPRIFRKIKLGAGDNIGTADYSEDSLLRPQEVDLFNRLRKLEDGKLDFLEVHNGLPSLMKIEEQIRP